MFSVVTRAIIFRRWNHSPWQVINCDDIHVLTRSTLFIYNMNANELLYGNLPISNIKYNVSNIIIKYVKYLWMMAHGVLDNTLFPWGGPFWSPAFHPRMGLSTWLDESDTGTLQKLSELKTIRPQYCSKFLFFSLFFWDRRPTCQRQSTGGSSPPGKYFVK